LLPKRDFAVTVFHFEAEELEPGCVETVSVDNEHRTGEGRAGCGLVAGNGVDGVVLFLLLGGLRGFGFDQIIGLNDKGDVLLRRRSASVPLLTGSGESDEGGDEDGDGG